MLLPQGIVGIISSPYIKDGPAYPKIKEIRKVALKFLS